MPLRSHYKRRFLTPDNQDDFMLSSLELTDAQIKSLPSTPVIIVPSPGPGKFILFNSSIIITHFEAQYTGVDNNSSLGFDNIQLNLSLVLANANLQTLLQDVLSTPDNISILASDTSVINLTVDPKTDFENLPLRLYANQNISGLDYGGGNVNNTMKIIVTYQIITL